LEKIKAQAGQLFINRYDERLAYDGLRGVMDRPTIQVGVKNRTFILLEDNLR